MSSSAPYFQDGVHYIKSSPLLGQAAFAADGCDPRGFAPNATMAQIMAAVSAEAFINEFALLLSGLARTGKAPELVRVGSILQQLEASRVQITEKYSIASQLLPGEPFDRGKEPFQSFAYLIKLRNVLVHPKPMSKPPKWFSYFVSNGLVVDSPDSEFIFPDWMLQLQNKTSASWACRATARIVLYFIDRIYEPCNTHDVPGIHEMLTSTWEWNKTDTRIWSGSTSDCI